MIAKVRAQYKDGVLTPLEPLDLEDGAEVSVTVEVRAKASATVEQCIGEVVEPDEGPGMRIIRMFEELRKDIPLEAWDSLPRDLAKNKKHYLYGHPKEED